MKMTVNSLCTLLASSGVAIAAWSMPTHALAGSCGKPPYAPGIHALVRPTSSNGIGLSQRRDSIVGLWHTVYTSGGVTAFESFEQWHADGNEFEGADLQLGSMCQGTWEQIAPGTVRLLHVGWNFDPTGVTLTGYFTENQTVTLNPDGATYDGTFALQNFDLSGNHIVGQDLSGTVHSTRLTVP